MAPGHRGPETGDRDGCCHLLEAVLNPEGGIFWGESPVRGLVSEEYELESPDGDCSEALWSAIGECGFLSTSEGCALFDGGETLPLPMPSAAACTGRPWRTATRTWRTP
ncbi:hypothetical protein KYY02_19930 [Streptomyces pimonensis]|uniref:Uncharacterized protein n=1 Tax=Streptomyces pimonensis TaxID=2860288 RepID=A0ABV4J1S2_9ACTN